MSDEAREHEKLTIAQLKQAAGAAPEPFAVHAQVESSTKKPTQTGKPYLEIKLSDGTEKLTWRVFDGAAWFLDAADLRKNDWIELAAYWQQTGKFGIEPRSVIVRRLNDEEVQALLIGDAATRTRQHEDFETITHFTSHLLDPRLRALCAAFLQAHGERFKRAAAARDFHHARRGGLVEHVAQMMRCAVKIAEAYPNLNRDLLIAGVLFHDCGKLWENNYGENSFAMPHNLHGELIGHIALGLEVVNKFWRQMMETDESAAWATQEPGSDLVRLHLLHLIGSHHGTMEFGSPVWPKTPEAIVLHHVDNIDAKLEMFRRAYATGTELGSGIFEKVRPLPANVVRPLAAAKGLEEMVVREDASLDEPPPAKDTEIPSA